MYLHRTICCTILNFFIGREICPNPEETWRLKPHRNVFRSFVHFQQLEDELDSKATAITNLTRQVSTLESERRELHENIYDAETALKTAAQDRHTLSNYVETLTNTFNKVCHGRGQSINGRRVGAFPTTLHVDMLVSICSKTVCNL